MKITDTIDLIRQLTRDLMAIDKESANVYLGNRFFNKGPLKKIQLTRQWFVTDAYGDEVLFASPARSLCKEFMKNEDIPFDAETLKARIRFGVFISESENGFIPESSNRQDLSL